MRNLKRALSMALAAVMVLGLMVVGASAASYNDFTDKDEIVHKDAVAMVTELGVLAGLPDGSFGGTQNIDRASFARLVCVVLNGGKEPVLGNLTTSFTDTQGNWAEKYIAFCVDRGIIAGRGNNTFGPSDNVTGSEAAKMLLVALGYNTTYEGIGGSTWEITTNSLANMAGLYDGLEDINPSDPLTRDNAAQMIYNVLNANTVDYSFSFNADGSTTAVQKKNETTMLEDKFGVVIVEGVVTANEFANLESTGSLDEGKTRIMVTNYKDGQNNYGNETATKAETFNVATGEDVLGRTVTLYVKPASTASTSASKATVVGSPIVSSENVVVTDLSKDTIAEVAEDNDLTTTGMTTCYNYASGSGVTPISVGQGVEKTLIDNDNDGVVDYTFITRFDLGKVTKYSTKDDGAIVVRTDVSSDEYEKDDVVGFDDVAKDDYVLTAVIGGKLYVEKAETITGTMEAYKTDSKNASLVTSLTVDGTAYKVANTAVVHSDLTAAASYGSTYLNSEATFYLDRNGYIVAAGEVEESAYSYAFVIAKDKATNNIDNDRVKVALADGTTGTYTFSDKGGIDDLDNVTVGDVYRYSLTSDNKIKLTDDTDNSISGTAGEFTKGKAAITVDGNVKAYASENTLFFYTSAVGKSVDVYTGFSKAPSTEVTSGEMTVYKNGDRIVAVVAVGGDAAVTADDHLFIYSVGSTYSDYTMADAVLSGATEVSEGIKVSEDGDAPVANTLYQYAINSDGEYVLDKITASDSFYSTGSVTQKYTNSFVLSGGLNGGELGLTNNTVVIDNTGDDPIVGDKSTFSKGDYVYAVVDGNGDAMMVVIMANDSDVYTVDMTKAASATVTVDGESVSISGNEFKAAAGATVVISGSGIDATTKYYINKDLQVESTGSSVVTFTMPAGNVTFGKAYSVTVDGGNAIWFVEGANVTAADVKVTGVDKVWDGASAVATSGNVVTGIAVDTTLTSMYKVTTAGISGADKINVAANTDTVGDTTTDKTIYVAVGETVTVTPDSGREATLSPELETTPGSGNFTFVMPSKNVTITFAAE